MAALESGKDGTSRAPAREEHRQKQRHAIEVERRCCLGVITFKELARTDLTVRITDISGNGVGIESASRVEPGFVVFRDRVAGFKSGILLWSRRQDDCYRAGIRFLPLRPGDEQYLSGYFAPSGTHMPHRTPEEIVSRLLDCLTGTAR